MSHHPGSEHPHVMEGVCTCPEGPLTVGSLTVHVRQSVPYCGLSSHRVEAAARRVHEHETKEK